MKKLLYIFCVLLVASCVKHSAENSPESRLEITARIAEIADSKVIHEGKDFKDGNTIGVFVYHSETKDVTSPKEMSEFSSYGSKYRNIRGVIHEVESSKSWKFNFENATTSFDDIYLLKPKVAPFETGMAVVAYAPWMANVEEIHSIPFTLGGEFEKQVDLLWARQNTHDRAVNSIDPGANYKIVPDGNVQYVNLTFQHALSLLRIGLKCGSEDSAVAVSSVLLKRKEGGSTPLCVSGLFDAMIGQIKNSVEGPKLEFKYTEKVQISTESYTYVPMLIAPQTYKADGDYILEFQFDGQQSNSKYEIKLSDVEGGFKPGNVYTFNFTIDGSIQCDGVTTSDEWI
ncbi:MAG: fimbrillin family protein [Bacteroidales bacterium]|nr:fimbrillin family protein [Bacteroidales bacterium]